MEGRPVVRSPEQLRLHRALEELGWSGVTDELNEAHLTSWSVPEPLLITTNGTILAGIGRWRAAGFDGRNEINCIEYPLSENEALQFIIRHHQPQRGWNAFIRIRLALKLEFDFQNKARDNINMLSFRQICRTLVFAPGALRKQQLTLSSGMAGGMLLARRSAVPVHLGPSL